VNAFAGAGALVRLAIRRSRLLIASWIIGFVVVVAVSADATVGLYPSLGSRIAAGETFNRSTALVALYGRLYDPGSVGALALVKLSGLGSVFVAMLAVVLVVRHTRADEESGRLELVGATATDRRAPITAALVLVVATNAVLGTLTAAALAATGLPVAGSIGFGLSWAGVGLVFGAVAAVTGQIASSARTATALAAGLLGLVYALRAVGDAAGAGGLRWLAWLSPVGWAQQVRPYAGDRWWALVVTLAAATLIGAGAVAIAARRDLGTGLLPTRPGPSRGSGRLGTPLGLAWRLQRTTFAGWGAAFLFLGALVGGLAASVGDFVNNPTARDVFRELGGRHGLTDEFLALELAFAGIIASAYGIQAVMRLSAEEHGGRAEPVLAAAVGRVRWALGHVTVAVGGVTVLMLLVGVGAGVTRAVAVGRVGEAGRVIAAALVQLPAAWVLVGIVVAAFGLAPRLVVVGWVALAAFVLLGELGPLVHLDQRVMDLSPWAHVPKLPGGTLTIGSVAALTVLAAALTAAGLTGLRRRDIA
jgi:ABC-2 type transport system permease protein